MVDPLAGADGAFVIHRQDGIAMAYPLDRYRMRTRTHFPKDWDHERAFGDFSRLFGSTTTFVGVAKR